MSSDLLDAFGSGHERQPAIPDTGFSANDEDDFGEFEAAQGHDQEVSALVKDTQSLNLYGNAEAKPTASSAFFDIDDTCQDDPDTVGVSNVPPPERTKFGNEPPSDSRDTISRTSVEEWGEFEGGTVLFDVDEVKNELSNDEQTQQAEQKQQRWPDWKDTSDFNAGDDWQAGALSHNSLVPSPAQNLLHNVQTVRPKPNLDMNTVKSKEPGPPPTNIPPPSILLAFVTLMFHSLPGELRAALPQASASADPRSTLGPHIREQLQKHFGMIYASTRIIAGRKLRWKRDLMLSQSMKIGPAGSGGAKLGNLDKSESLREDLEVGEALEVWRRQRGLLRSLMAKANAQAPGLDLMLPDIAETIPVRQAKAGEGALAATKSCFLCGINRDERVAKLDLFVEDSFGEWWTEHWGHVDCVIFWEECKSKLPQR